MATVLSRALKLPGKKSHDPREYDPLTQADSDESEDDLVINIQHNGVQNGKGSRSSYHDPDSDVERASKRVQQRPVDAKEEGLSPSGGLDLELKATSPVVSYIRTTVFLLTVVVSMVMVLICAFLIPCPHRGHHQFWTLRIGQETGIPSPLELFDVNMDGVPDILISFASPKNVSQDAMRHHNSVAALSGINNSILWISRVQEEIQSINCGLLVPDSPQNNTCLLIGRSKFLQLVNATSGKPVWTSSVHLSNGVLATSAIVLPDLNGDYISDLLVLTVGEQQPHLGFQLVSGLSGHLLGEVVKYEATVKGKLQGPQVHYTTQGAIYILFGFGNVQAVALKDIYTQAKTGESLPKALQKKDPEWEKWRTVNGSQTINVYRTGVEFLQSIPVLDSNCSDLLITTSDGLTLLRGKDIEKRWTVSMKNIKSLPQPGHFNPDGSLDFLLQIHSNNTSKKIIIIDGTSGVPIWEWEVPWHVKEAAAASVPTSDGKSAFVFWGDGSLPANSTNLNIQVDTQWNRHLLLLHPSYPGVILDIFNVSANIVTMAIGIKELEKDAFVVIVTSDRNMGASDNVPQTLVVSKLALRWAMSYSHPLSVGDAKMRPKVDDVKRILSRLKFGTIPQKP